MSKNDTPATDAGGAWEKDKQHGNRLDHAFALGEKFLLLGARTGEPVATTLGVAPSLRMLVRRCDANSEALGGPFEVATIAGAIVAKLTAAVPTDYPAVVVLRRVGTKFGADALVLHYIGQPGFSQSSLLAEYGVQLEVADGGSGVLPEGF